MDAELLRLLREVKVSPVFQSKDESETEKRLFTRKIRMLKELKAFGYVYFHDAHAVPDHSVSFESYQAVGPVSLTQAGMRESELALLISPVNELKETLEDLSLDMCLADFSRALDSLPLDPAQSLANASSCFESIAKAILDQWDERYPSDQSMQNLFVAALKCLKLNPADTNVPEIKRLGGGLLNVASAVGVMRTQNSAAHGKGERQQVAGYAEARLALNALAAAGIYLLEISQEQMRREEPDDD